MQYVYRLSNLPLVETPNPCATNRNRFVRKNAGSDSTGCAAPSNNQFPSIATAITNYLSGVTSSERSAVRVIDLTDVSLNCYDAFDDSLGASFTITIPGSTTKACFTHSYEYEFSVFVMNDWVVSCDDFDNQKLSCFQCKSQVRYIYSIYVIRLIIQEIQGISQGSLTFERVFSI